MNNFVKLAVGLLLLVFVASAGLNLYDDISDRFDTCNPLSIPNECQG